MFEGLQNAEDVGASQFSFMLDLRHHAGKKTDPKLRRFAGPAFVLADNGKGFADRDWKSLQNLHDSEKQHTPSEIGSFGMGTRSYFHYTDAIFVASNSTYVGLDPTDSVEEGCGWKVEIGSEEASRLGVRMFDFPQLGCDAATGHVKGSVFRLPLRLPEHAAEGMGKEIPTDTAKEMMKDFALQLSGGELLLFLPHVSRVDLWLWEPEAAEPTLLERVDKTHVEGTPMWRLPPWIPEDACQSFTKLAAFTAKLDDAERCKLGQGDSCVVETRTLKSDSARQWLVKVRFDTRRELTEKMEACRAVPVVGVALALGREKVRGRAFNFLPVGDLFTELPVHLNACFQLKKDRRDLWHRDRNSSSLGLAGEQVQWAEWNLLLLSDALPALWRDLLVHAAERTTEVREAAVAGVGVGGH